MGRRTPAGMVGVIALGFVAAGCGGGGEAADVQVAGSAAFIARMCSVLPQVPGGPPPEDRYLYENAAGTVALCVESRRAPAGDGVDGADDYELLLRWASDGSQGLGVGLASSETTVGGSERITAPEDTDGGSGLGPCPARADVPFDDPIALSGGRGQCLVTQSVTEGARPLYTVTVLVNGAIDGRNQVVLVPAVAS